MAERISRVEPDHGEYSMQSGFWIPVFVSFYRKNAGRSCNLYLNLAVQVKMLSIMLRLIAGVIVVRIMHVHVAVVGSPEGILFLFSSPISCFGREILKSSITFIGQLNSLLAIKVQDVIANLCCQILVQNLIPHRA